MSVIAVPEFYCPFESSINPHLRQVQEHSLKWIHEIGLAEKNRSAYDLAKLEGHASLVAYCLPRLPLDDLKLAADAMTWFFVHDDYMDGSFCGSLDELQDLHRTLLDACAADCAPKESGEPLERGLLDICRRIAARSGDRWLTRFADSVREYLESIRWERDLRTRGLIPDLAAYMQLRPVVGTIYMVFCLVAILNDIPADARFLQHILIRKLTDLAGLQMTFYNDIWSLKRDLHERNSSNLISVLQNENQIALQEAVNLAVSLTNKQVVAFINLKNMLPKFEAGEDAMAQQYVESLENFMSGHQSWMRQTRRFDIA